MAFIKIRIRICLSLAVHYLPRADGILGENLKALARKEVCGTWLRSSVIEYTGQRLKSGGASLKFPFSRLRFELYKLAVTSYLGAFLF